MKLCSVFTLKTVTGSKIVIPSAWPWSFALLLLQLLQGRAAPSIEIKVDAFSVTECIFFFSFKYVTGIMRCRNIWFMWLLAFRFFDTSEWCRIKLGIKLGLRAGMARQVLDRVDRGRFFLSWCQYSRWVRLEHYGEKRETFRLSSARGASVPELSPSPQNR